MLTKKVETYTIKEFMLLETLEDEKMLDKMIGHIKKNPVLYAKLVYIVAITLFSLSNPSSCYALGSDALGWIDSLGHDAMEVVQKVGFYIISTMGILDVIKETTRGGTHNLSSLTTRYVILIAALFLLPKCLDTLKAKIMTYQP